MESLHSKNKTNDNISRLYVVSLLAILTGGFIFKLTGLALVISVILAFSFCGHLSDENGLLRNILQKAVYTQEHMSSIQKKYEEKHLECSKLREWQLEDASEITKLKKEVKTLQNEIYRLHKLTYRQKEEKEVESLLALQRDQKDCQQRSNSDKYWIEQYKKLEQKYKAKLYLANKEKVKLGSILAKQTYEIKKIKKIIEG